MLLANYGSDSGSDTESGPSKPVTRAKEPFPPPKTTGASGPALGSASASRVKRKGPVKITLDLPKVSTKDEDESIDDSAVNRDQIGDGEAEGKVVKKPKLVGAGGSSLLGLLPPPKRKLQAPKSSTSSLAVNKSMAVSKTPASSAREDRNEVDDDNDKAEPTYGSIFPVSDKLSKVTEKLSQPELDLFGLSSTSFTPKQSLLPIPSPAEISSAPQVADFIPPEPAANDPYPGYYQLPSGSWAAYDPEYYASFFPSTSTETGPDLAAEAKARDEGRVGRHWADFDDGRANIVEINATAGLEAARKEEERKQQMVKPRLPGDEYEYTAIGQTKGLAQERHQLTSLLNTAFTQRDELEARISQNKKNMRMAGQKYGF